MRRRTFVLLAAGQTLGLVLGCKKEDEAGKKAAALKGPPYPDVTLCGKCGQVKGSPLCCKPGQTMCKKCGLVAGSPGCCTIKKGDDVTLCGKCGQVKGSELCCKPGQEKCPKCGLSKGSPGCCKLNKLAAEFYKFVFVFQ